MLQAVNNLMAGRTTFVIAHRLSTIKDVGKILYMQDGDIKEQGIHEELLAKGGYYAAQYFCRSTLGKIINSMYVHTEEFSIPAKKSF
ncbi:hypothetical protein IGI42_002099 [Enterococcus sp. AZ109]